MDTIEGIKEDVEKVSGRDCVIGRGSSTPKYLFIGEALGAEEEKQGKPFVGPSGKLLNQWIEYCGIKDDKYFITNTVFWRPESNRDPTQEEISLCAPYLKRLIGLLNPDYVVCIGRFAMNYFFPEKKSIMREGGKFTNDKYYIIPHPSYFLRNGGKGWEKFLYGLRSSVGLPSVHKIEKKLVNTKERFHEVVVDIKESEYISIDTETTSVNTYSLEIIGFSIYTGKYISYYIPVNHKTNNFKEIDFNLLQESLKGKKLLFHNFVFDGTVFRKYGVDLTEEKYFDTMVAAHLTYEHQPKGLKDLSSILFGYGMQQFDEVSKNVRDFRDIPPSKMTPYACDDVIMTFKLFERFRTEIREKNLDYLFFKVEMPFLRVLVRAREVGVKFNINLCNSYISKIEKEIQEVEEEIFKYNKTNQQTLFGDSVNQFDVSSSHQISTFLYKKLGLPIIERTKSGAAATGTPVLKRMEDEHPVIPFIIKHRKLSKLYTSYIKSLPQKVDNDGRLRTEFLTHRAKTGRLSSQYPNFQQLPNTDSDISKKYNIRKCFTTNPNMKMIVIDYSQQELRVAAFLSGDVNMKEAYKKNLDIHFNTANASFNLNLKDEDIINDGSDRYKKLKETYHEQRDRAKAINFQVLYGGGSNSLKEALKCTEKEAQEVIDNYFAKYPMIKKAINNTHRDVRKYKYVTNYFGRRRHFQEINNEAYRESFNFKIQSFGADLLRLVSSKIYDEFKGTDLELVMFVHDEIVFICEEQNVNKYLPHIKDIMENTVKIDPPLLVESDVGDNYSEAK